MKITSYLIFNGEAEEAANFYAGVLSGKIRCPNLIRQQPDLLVIPDGSQVYDLIC